MDWIVFGDDFGAHPSTTQHLVRRFPPGDRVVWVDSIGMRTPRFSAQDLRRIGGRLRSWGVPSPHRASDVAKAAIPGPVLRVVKPRISPWHDGTWSRRLNGRLLRHQLGGALDALGIRSAHALLSNPVAYHYLGGLPIGRVGYLRLDDYPRLPGVDAAMVAPVDEDLTARADLVFGTARSLLPPGEDPRFRYLPQGVDTAHFSGVPLVPPPGKTLGFFGLLAEWLDYDLIREVARLAPDWTLEFRGPVRSLPADIPLLPNVRLLPPVSYDALPALIGHWRAAWIPFARTRLTDGVNPLKLREYLAAGFPTASTPLPEVRALGGEVSLVEDAAGMVTFLAGTEQDSEAARGRRRLAMASHDWQARADSLRAAFAEAAS